MMWDWWNWGWGTGIMMLVGGLMMLVFWGGIIALVIWLLRRPMGHEGYGPGTREKRDPMDIAKERYARGEINKEQYEQIKKDIA